LTSFSGAGNVLGRKSQTSSLVHIGGTEFNPSLTTPTKSPRRPRSDGGSGDRNENRSGGGGIGLHELYRKLPPDTKILRNGQMIDMRSEIGRKLKTGGGGDNSKEVDVDRVARRIDQVENDALIDDDEHADENVSTLRIRLPEGKPLVIKLIFQRKVSDLYEIVSMRTKLPLVKFELRSSFPNKSYELECANGLTLEEAGLVPSAVLILRKL
jgi:hypothetical protein